MAMLLVQLSDLHATVRGNSCEAKWEALCRAVVAEIDGTITQVVIAFCGDAAWAGLPDEFEVTRSLLGRLRNYILETFPNLNVVILSVPGNHDCDLSEDSTARDALRKVTDGRMPQKSVSRVLLAAQESYFIFSQILHPDALSPTHPFYRCVDLSVDGQCVRFHLLNSAWTSVVHETTDLRYPLEAFKAPVQPNASLSITMVHHPIHWFLMPGVRRELRDIIESHSDVVLTGHEHQKEASQRDVVDGPTLEYIEGGVLQESKLPNLCTFNTIRIDLGSRSQQLTGFTWSVDHFEVASRNEVPLRINLARKDRRSTLKAKFVDYLDELEDPLVHPRGGELRLSHIFAYPDLRRYEDLALTDKNRASGIAQRIPSRNVRSEMIDPRRALITGGEKSGKTSFAKYLYADIHQSGKYPVLIKGGAFGRSGSEDGMRRVLEQAISDQYERISPAAYDQLHREDRVLIVDDFHIASGDSALRAKILRYLKVRFDKIVLFSSDEFYFEILNSKKPDLSELVTFQRYDICEFGHVRLEELAERWVTFGREASDPVEKNSIISLCEKVEQIVAVAGLPHTPWLLILTLEQAETEVQPAAKNGSYGFLYQAVLTAALSRSTMKQIDIAGKYTYLGELAYQLYRLQASTLSEAQCRQFHQTHCERYDIVVDYDKIITDLVETRMLRNDDGEVSFRHRYTFSFFVAWWLSRNIHRTEARDIVASVCCCLHNEVLSNIIVFLAHLSDDPIILSEMRKSAAKLFADDQPTVFGEELRPLNDLPGIESLFQLPSTPPEVNRRLRQEEADERAAKREQPSHDGRTMELSHKQPTVSDETANVLNEIRAAIRTIRILGQVLRNKASSIQAADKLEVMGEVLRLGRRLLGHFYSYLDHFDEMVEDVHKRCLAILNEMRKEDKRGESLNDLEIAEDDRMATGFSNRFWFDLHVSVTLSMLRRMATAVGLKQLDGTLQKVIDKDSCLPNDFVNIGVKLARRESRIPANEIVELHERLKRQGNKMPRLVLEALTIDRIILYETQYADKQKVSQQFGLPKVPVKSLDTSRKVYRPGST